MQETLTEREAKEILQEKIGFGSVQIYYQVTEERGFPIEKKANLSYKESKKMELGKNGEWTLVDIKHSTDCQKEDDEELER